MNTAYNTNTTTVQESRNRYNALLAQALERLKARKTDETAQEPEEVTTKPTEASKPEEVTTTRKTTTTRRTKTASPKALGRDIYHIFTDKDSRWPSMFDSGVYHDPEGYALISDNVILIESKLDYKDEYSGKLIKENGTESKSNTQQLSKYKEICKPIGRKYAIAPKEVEERIKATETEEKRTALCKLFGKDMTPEEVKEELKYNKEARAYANAMTKHQFVKLLLQTGDIYTSYKHLKRAIKVAKTLGTESISSENNILQLAGEGGRVIVAGVVTSTGCDKSMDPLTIDLTDATPDPEDTTAIEEATPATDPQEPEEVTTTETPVQEPEEVTTEEVTPAPADIEEEEMRKRREADDITVLKYCVEHCGEVGADYLDTLDYTQAEAREYRSVKGGVSKPEQKYYTTEDGIIYGLFRRYNRNGKRAEFVVYQDGQIIEVRTYGKNNNTYKAELRCTQTQGSIVRYEVKDGKVTRAEYLLTRDDKKPLSVVFDDSNRPETPRDLPAPAPTKPTSKETTKETTKEEPATPETTTATEVTTTSTDQPEDEPTPYWLLLDNELRAQQEEQEQAPATPEKSEEEPAEEPAPDNEETDDPEEVGFLKGAELEKAIDEYIEKTEYLSERLDLKFYKSHYYYYITTDGYIVKLDKSKPKKDLYIPDEGPFYESYAKGEITDRDIFFAKNMKTLDKYMRERLETPVLCSVRRTMMGDLSIDPFGRTEYSYDPSTGKSEELPTKRPTPRELAIYVAAWDAYEADQRARLERYWKRYAHKVCVNTYWANR